jgi:hypothetical protein
MNETRHRRAVRPLLILALALTAVVAPVPAQAADGRFGMDLARDGDFVPQTNFVQCVGASMQMMLNMIEPRNDRTARTQLTLQKMARRLSPPRPDGSVRQGASVIGWTAGLNQLGAGPYRLDGSYDLATILHNAAGAMRETRRPVGLLMWRGRHAWVMAGFRATADPAKTDDFRVTHVVVMDPLYPYGSSVWGRSPRPAELISVARLGEQFRPRRRGHRSSLWLADYEGMYVTVLPYRAVPGAAGADDDVAGGANGRDLWSRGSRHRFAM